MRNHYLEIHVKNALKVVGVVQAWVEGLVSQPEHDRLFPECKTGPVLLLDIKVMQFL